MRDAARWQEGFAARREARRAGRRARFDEGLTRHGAAGQPGPPRPVRIFLALLFLIGIMAVWFATQLIVPIVLGMLSLFFARDGLSRAAVRVQGAGRSAIRAIDRSRRWILDPGATPSSAGRESGERSEDAHVRVPGEEGTPSEQDIRSRVEIGETDRRAREEEDEAEQVEGRARKGSF